MPNVRLCVQSEFQLDDLARGVRMAESTVHDSSLGGHPTIPFLSSVTSDELALLELPTFRRNKSRQFPRGLSQAGFLLLSLPCALPRWVSGIPFLRVMALNAASTSLQISRYCIGSATLQPHGSGKCAPPN